MKINKTRDWLERTAWTFINTFVGLVIADNLLGSFSIDAVHKLEGAALAAFLTTVKVLVAQQGHDDGAAIPGGVIDSASPDASTR